MDPPDLFEREPASAIRGDPAMALAGSGASRTTATPLTLRPGTAQLTTAIRTTALLSWRLRSGRGERETVRSQNFRYLRDGPAAAVLEAKEILDREGGEFTNRSRAKLQHDVLSTRGKLELQGPSFDVRLVNCGRLRTLSVPSMVAHCDG